MKLRELLPHLQGKAGEFVYGQLSRGVRANFEQLVRELKHWFRKVETSRTYAAQFSNQSQEPGESIEDYAAELKRLYDKAHANRDKETRREDLLRRFLDGLLDDRARFQVEFTKEPDNIDRAVFEVVNFQETRKRAKAAVDQSDKRHHRPARAVRNDSSAGSSNEMTSDDKDVRAVQTRQYPSCNRKNNYGSFGQDKAATQDPVNKDSPLGKAQPDDMQEIEVLKQRIEQLQRTVSQSAPICAPLPNQPYTSCGPCFRCGQADHYARDCPHSTQSQPVASGIPRPATSGSMDVGNKSTRTPNKLLRDYPPGQEVDPQKSKHLGQNSTELGVVMPHNGSKDTGDSGATRRGLPRCDGIYIQGFVQGDKLFFAVDTGASVTIVSMSLFRRIPKGLRPKLTPTKTTECS